MSIRETMREDWRHAPKTSPLSTRAARPTREGVAPTIYGHERIGATRGAGGSGTIGSRISLLPLVLGFALGVVTAVAGVHSFQGSDALPRSLAHESVPPPP